MTTLQRGGWLNSDLLLSISWLGLLKILTASFACLVMASLNFWVISILNLTFSSWWSVILCLKSTLLSFSFSRSFKCAAPRILADRPVSPSYTFVIFLSLHVTQSHLYPTLLVLQGILTSVETTSIHSLSVHRGQVFCAQCDFLNGFFDPKMSLIFRPPFSSIFILSLLFLFNSSSLFLSSLARTPLGVG